LSDGAAAEGRNDDLAAIGMGAGALQLDGAVAGWRLDRYRELVAGPGLDQMEPGQRWEVDGGDVVSGAPELARLSLNLAFAHHDRAVSPDGRRLVYGGHTIGLVGSQVARAIPNLVTIVAWHSCDHLAPVHEGDTVRTALELERAEPLESGGGLLHLRARARAEETEVLDWRFVAVMA
jgi:acyl dehydratase